MPRTAFAFKVGNATSCFAIAKDDGTAKVIENLNGERTTPAYLGFTDHEAEIGSAAKEHIVRNAPNTVFALNKVLGKKFKDVGQAEFRRWDAPAKENSNGDVAFTVNYMEEKKDFTANELTVKLIQKIKGYCDRYTSEDLKDCVVVVPPYFTELAQKDALKNACEELNLHVMRYITEPAAALLACDVVKEANAVVLDIGANNVSCSLVHSSDGIYNLVKTITDESLGALSFATRLMQHFAAEFAQKTKLNVTTNKRSVHKLRVECERIMKILSSAKICVATVESLMDGADLNSRIERTRFEQLCKPQFEATLKPIGQLFEDKSLHIERSEITHVILTGGGANIPALQTMVKNEFPNAQFRCDVNPEETVTLGAAKQAGLVMDFKDYEKHSQYTETEALSETISVEKSDGTCFPVLRKITPLPARKQFGLTVSENFMLRLVEGDSEKASENKLLREIPVEGIDKEQHVSVNFYCNHAGALRVTVVGNEEGKHFCDVNIH